MRRCALSDPVLTLSGGGTTTIATDVMLGDAYSIGLIADLVVGVSTVIDLAASSSDERVTVTWNEQLFEASLLATDAKGRADFISARLTEAIAAYSAANASATGFIEVGSDALAWAMGSWLGTLPLFNQLATYAVPGYGLMLSLMPDVREQIRAHFASKAGELAPDDIALPQWFNELITNPLATYAVRMAVSSADNGLSGFGGDPAALLASLKEQGITGQAAVAAILSMWTSVAGVLKEGPVKVTQTAVEPVVPPRNNVELMEAFPVVGEPGQPQIRIDTMVVNGETRYQVIVGGTVDFNPIPGQDAFDTTSNVAAVAGLPAGSVRAVELAMADMGIDADSPVTFVGYSAGGIVAATLAASGDYNTRGVVTVGAPVGHIILPSGVPAAIIEHTDDPVPALGGLQENSEALIVQNQAFLNKPIPTEALPAHRIETYIETASAMDNEIALELRDFNDAFYAFSDGATTATSTYYYAEREG